jgi:hypothetical protein
MGVLGGLAVAGIGALIAIRKFPLWRDQLRALVQGKGIKRHDGPRLVLEGAPQRQSPLGED